MWCRVKSLKKNSVDLRIGHIPDVDLRDIPMQEQTITEFPSAGFCQLYFMPEGIETDSFMVLYFRWIFGI